MPTAVPAVPNQHRRPLSGGGNMVQAVKVAQSGELKGVDAISLNLNSVLVSAPSS